jgi:hypothetical protein
MAGPSANFREFVDTPCHTGLCKAKTTRRWLERGKEMGGAGKEAGGMDGWEGASVERHEVVTGLAVERIREESESGVEEDLAGRGILPGEEGSCREKKGLAGRGMGGESLGGKKRFPQE